MDALHHGYMEDSLGGEFPIGYVEYCASWRKDSISRWHVVYLIPFCRIVYGLRMPKASTILFPGVVNLAEAWDGVSRSPWSPYCIVVISLSLSLSLSLYT